MLFIALLIFTCCAVPAARAQSTNAADEQGEVTKQPICFNVINRAPYTVLGTISTNYYSAPDGTRARHRGNFRLGAMEQTNFCSSGPFYDGRKLDLVLHSLIPLFSCRTAITGDIVITGKQDPDGTTHDTKAACR